MAIEEQSWSGKRKENRAVKKAVSVWSNGFSIVIRELKQGRRQRQRRH